MDATTTTQPIAAQVDPAVTATPRADVPSVVSPSAEPIIAAVAMTTPVQMLMIVLGPIAFLYFARPVVLPVFLACVAAMTLKPLIRWLSYCHIRPALSAAVVLCVLVSGIAIGAWLWRRKRGGTDTPRTPQCGWIAWSGNTTTSEHHWISVLPV